MADDICALGCTRTQDECRGVVTREAHEQIRIDELALVSLALVLVQRRERPPRGRAVMGERVGPVAMRHAAHPVEPRPAALAKCRDDRTKLRMNSSAVIA